MKMREKINLGMVTGEELESYNDTDGLLSVWMNCTRIYRPRYNLAFRDDFNFSLI